MVETADRRAPGMRWNDLRCERNPIPSAPSTLAGMSNLRFELGAAVMCNMGSSGWKLGRIIALRYREDHWPAGMEAPYQVALEDDHELIYVPEDDPRYCREPSPADLRIARRMDALAALPPGEEGTESQHDTERLGDTAAGALSCAGDTARPGSPGYRDGGCRGCHRCPRSWSCVELYSEHYRCAARNGLRVTRRAVDLGTVRVGDSLHLPAGEGPPSGGGFLQCPTLVRLPPGVRFSDDGALAGELRFDPHRAASYRVEFVAVSTADWDDAAVGIVRLEISFLVEGNEPPTGFDVGAFTREQERARAAAKLMLRELINTWSRWERGALSNRDTCDQMRAELGRLRALLERHPRLDGGRWWAQLGGFHMNVHKLLENALFECELYLGHALTFGDPEVRRMAEQNLAGCYQKRLLEAARFLWIDGVKQMMRGEWATAAETLRRAAAKVDGWELRRHLAQRVGRATRARRIARDSRRPGGSRRGAVDRRGDAAPGAGRGEGRRLARVRARGAPLGLRDRRSPRLVPPPAGPRRRRGCLAHGV